VPFRPWNRGLLLVPFLLAWFVFFSWDGLRAHFSPDDMMNIDSFYWTPGQWRLLISQFLLWRGYYRPMGGLFYLPILSGWGLNPLPYHVALSIVLLLNVWLVYRLARLLGADWPAAALAALVACYHAGLSNLYYNTAFVYDALCGCFYFGALLYYVRIRAGGRFPGARQTLIFAALLVCALNSKEMALTLPAALLAYEWCYHRPLGRGAAKMVGLAGVLVLLNLYGKIWGVDALTGMVGYRPVFSLQRVHDFQRTFLGDAAFLHAGWGGILAFWAVVTYLAWRPGARTVLRFCWLFLLLAPLPIEFLPGKSQACLYIPMIGGAVFAAVVLVDVARAAADFLSREPLFGRLGRPALFAVLLAAAVFYWGRVNLNRKIADAKPVMAALGRQTAEVIEQFRELNPQVSSGSHVVFLNDPFQEWDMLFIADLWFRDRSITVHLQKKTPLTPAELAGIPSWFDYREGRLVRLK
jgi:hypothetical protein